MQKNKPVVIIVMPAYYAEKTLERTFQDVPKSLISEIILVDDASSDKTAQEAKRLGITTFTHPHNLGYGGNQKTCYWEALKKDPDVVVMLHPDYQYDGTKIPDMINPILKGEYDIMLGSRIRTREEALAGGMPPVKYVVNRLMTTIENIVLGVNLSEHLSGFRAYSKKVLQTIPWQKFSNDFVFDQEFIVSAISYKFRIGEVAVPVRYFTEASSIGGVRAVKFVAETGMVLLSYILHQLKLVKSSIFK